MQRPEEGEKRLAAWLATQPKDTSSRAVLAESLIKRKQFAAASEQYLLLNASNPDNLLILNNLAWALFESGDKRAATYAEQALKLKPDNPAVMDTLGWILVQQGQRERGIKLEIKGAPAIAFVDGKMIKGIHEHLFAVLRDIIFISSEITDNPNFDLTRTEGITDAVFHIMRNANVLQPQRNPNLVVCWGGHSIGSGNAGA